MHTAAVLHIHVLCCFVRSEDIESVCENTFLKNFWPSLKKSKLPSHQVFGVFAAEVVNKILQAMPSKLGREMGMCATTMYVQQKQQCYTIRVLVVRSLEPLVPDAACLTPGTIHASTQQTIQTHWYGGLSRA